MLASVMHELRRSTYKTAPDYMQDNDNLAAQAYAQHLPSNWYMAWRRARPHESVATS